MSATRFHNLPEKIKNNILWTSGFITGVFCMIVAEQIITWVMG